VPLFSTVMPRTAAGFMIGGAFAGVGSLYAMAIADKSPSKVPLHVAGVDDRAYRISKNAKIEKAGDFVAAGTVAALVTGRSLTGKGFFGHIGLGMAWATVGKLIVLVSVVMWSIDFIASTQSQSQPNYRIWHLSVVIFCLRTIIFGRNSFRFRFVWHSCACHRRFFLSHPSPTPAAHVFLYAAVPEAIRRWPEYRPAVEKTLKDLGIPLPESPPPAPPAKKK
jgi:hypothetical protein